jgi:hypothetical protein
MGRFAKIKTQFHMSQDKHKEFTFSVTIHSEEYALISSMRGLAFYCQGEISKQISWGNTKEKDWAKAGRKAKFHFSRQNYRDNFIREAQNLFRDGLWRIEGIPSNNDPARPAD